MLEKNEVGDAFGAALNRMLKANPDRTIAAAAKQLGISRQAFHAYLKGKLPRRKTLNRAMHLWNLKLDLREYSFSDEAFGPKEPKKARSQESASTQLALWQMLDNITENDLRVTMKRVGKVLRFDVQIEISA
jgi:hypothetical protein